MDIEYKEGFTHGGKFHADDVFATALLKILFPKIKITRGFQVPEDFDGIVYDIGFGKFDHHQADKEYRENGVPYAAFGLLWREFGEELVGAEEAEHFDEQFVQPMDLSDNTGCYSTMGDIVDKFNTNWDDKTPAESKFWESVGFAKKILQNYIDRVRSNKKAESMVKEAMDECDGRILVLKEHLPWKSVVCGSSYKCIVSPSNRGGYNIQIVPVSQYDPTLTATFPKEWFGQTPEVLKEISGIQGLNFCHASGFLAAAADFESAMEVASCVE